MEERDKLRIEILEEQVDDLCADVKKILINHLPHLNTKVAVIIAQMAIVMAGLAYLIFR